MEIFADESPFYVVAQFLVIGSAIELGSRSLGHYLVFAWDLHLAFASSDRSLVPFWLELLLLALL